MTNLEIIRHIDSGANFYLQFFGDAAHMEYTDNGVYSVIRPKDGEQGVSFVFDVRLEQLSDDTAKAAAKAKIAEIRSLNFPVWWPLYLLNSVRIRNLIWGEDYQPPQPSDSDELYMALLPENQPMAIADKNMVKRVSTTEDFKIFADIANTIFSNGYQDIHPTNHYHWCVNGRLAAFIAYFEDKPVAVAAILNNNGIASLEFVATLEHYRHKGLARAACVAAIREVFADGAKIITARAFRPANLMYESLGFQTYPLEATAK